MITVTAFDHLVLCSAQPQRLVDFYCQHLGAVIERQIEEPLLIQLRLGTFLLDISEAELRQKDVAVNVDHFCFRISNFDQTRLADYFEENNIPFTPPEHRYGATGFADSIYLWDPDGNKVELRKD